jgi:DNA-binding transcriptional MerR regulator
VTDRPALSIGDLALSVGTKVETIRYYEKVGILPLPARSSGNHRVYTQAHADRLAFVRHSRELGFPIDAIRTMLTMAVDAIARDHLAAVQSRINRLQALEAELARMVDECGQGRVGDCRVIEVLADHSHANCLGVDHIGIGF